jgi:hypothetical protein
MEQSKVFLFHGELPVHNFLVLDVAVIANFREMVLDVDSELNVSQNSEVVVQNFAEIVGAEIRASSKLEVFAPLVVREAYDNKLVIKVVVD